MVGGRSYNQSQLNRVITRAAAARVGLQAVRLSRGVRARRPGRRRDRLARVTGRRFADDVGVRRPGVDARELRERVRRRHHVPPGARALAQHRGDQGRRAGRLRARRRVLATSCASGTPPKAYPSIALGVFEATPFEIATAYTMFPNLGVVRPLRHIERIDERRRRGEAEAARGAAPGRGRRHDLPRPEHDAQRDQRGHRRRRAGGRLHARRGRQDRHDQRPARRLVRRLHARPADGRLGRATTRTSRLACPARRRRCRSGRSS